MDKFLGSEIRGYRFLELLGAGGQASVYKAYQVSIGRNVAIKVIPPEIAKEESFIKRFKREAQTVALLEHANVVPLYDYWHSEAEGAFLAMRLMRGGSLIELIRNKGALRLEEVARIIDQVCNALTLAHMKQIVHRDIKPGNILLDEAGNAFLGDFGIAKRLTETEKITDTGDMLGTIGYAAPEQAYNTGIFSQTDIYSVGVVLYECLAGEYPFPNSPLAHLQQSLPRLSKVRSDLPLEIDDLISKATKYDVAARHASIQEFNETLQKIARKTPSSAPVMIPNLQRAPTGIPAEPHTDFVFVSHSSKDDEIVEAICNRLLEEEIVPWVDHRYMDLGADWDDAIQSKLIQCSEGIFVVSKNSVESAECRSEWRTILTLNKRLYPVVIDEIPTEKFPWRLQLMQYSDIQQDMVTTLRNLCTQIKEDRLGRESSGTTQVVMANLQPAPSQQAILFKHIDDIVARPEQFLERSDVLSQIETLLAQFKRVVLHGFGGVGKTTLAAEVAARHMKAKKGSVLWLTVGDGSALGLLNGLIRGLQSNRSVNTLDGSKGLLRDLLTNAEVTLIVLDDVWSDGQDLKQLVEVVPPSVSLLLTSRQRYPVGRIVDIDVLDDTEALALLNLHAYENFSEDDAAAMKLCRLLGNHPLALEIAGKTLQVDYLMPEDLLRRIEKAPHRMQMPEGYAEQGRESMKQLLDVSLSALDINSSEVFLAFGLFSELSVTPTLMAYCLGQDVDDLTQALVLLLRRGLVRREHFLNTQIYRYKVHSLAQDYARANMQLDEQFGIRGAITYVKEYVDDMDALDAERANILKIAEHAQKIGKYDNFLDIIYTLTVTSDYLKARGYDDLLLHLMDLAIELTRDTNKLEQLHYFLGRRADAYRERMKHDDAIVLYEEAIEIADELDLKDREVIVRWCASISYSELEEFDGAETHLERASQIATKLNDKSLFSRVLGGRAHIAQMQNDMEKARMLYQEQAEFAREADNVELLFWALFNTASANINLSVMDAAASYLAQATQLAEEQNNLIWKAWISLTNGILHDRQNKREQAQEMLATAGYLFASSGLLEKKKEIDAYMIENRYSVEP